MNCHWRIEHNKSSINFIKSEIAMKKNYKYNCKDFCVFVLNEKDILEPVK
jgi:hypothetical protein